MSRPLVVGGVSGTGKTTVAREVAQRLDRPFLDADDLHSEASVAKMAAGTPLEDADRWAWLDDVGDWLAAHPSGVCACSALSHAHRERLRTRAGDVRVVLLEAPAAVLSERLATRRGHYMPASLLDSQLEVYEPPGSGEDAVTVDATSSPDRVTDAVVQIASS